MSSYDINNKSQDDKMSSGFSLNRKSVNFKAKSENNKIPLKSRFVTTFDPNTDVIIEKDDEEFDNVFDDAFKDN